MVILIFVAFIVMCIAIDAVVSYNRKKKSKLPAESLSTSHLFSEVSIMVPKGLYFDKTHTWAFMEADGKVKIGVDDFIPHLTGTFSRVRLKNIGERVMKGEPLITLIRYGKQITLNSPISGIVKSHNNLLKEDCSLIKTSPYNNGWIYQIEPSNWLRDMQFLVMSDKYREWLKNEFSRFKDFLSAVGSKNNPEFVPVVLQDGGELKEDILADFDPEVWEEFQTKFINTSK